MTVRETLATWVSGRFGRYLLVGSEKLLRIPVGVLVSALASRALGVDDFGLYTSILVLLTVMAPLASFGLESLGIAMASKSADAATYLRRFAPLRLLTGVGAMLLFVVTATALPASALGEVSTIALAAIGAVLVMRIHELGEHLLFAREQLSMVAAVRICSFLIASLVIVLVLLESPNLSLLLIVVATESLLLLVLYVGVFRRAIVTAIRLPASDGGFRQNWVTWRAAFPVFLSGLLVLLLLNADKLLVFLFMGSSESGLYNAAAKLVDVLFFIPLVIGTTHAAAFARLAPGGRLPTAYRGAFITATAVSVAVAAALTLFAYIVIPVVYGTPFEAAVRPLMLLAPSLVPITWVSLRTRALAALDLRKEILGLTLAACAVHLPLLAVGLWIGTLEAIALCQTLGWTLAAVVIPLTSRASRGMSPLHVFRTSS